MTCRVRGQGQGRELRGKGLENSPRGQVRPRGLHLWLLVCSKSFVRFVTSQTKTTSLLQALETGSQFFCEVSMNA